MYLKLKWETACANINSLMVSLCSYLKLKDPVDEGLLFNLKINALGLTSYLLGSFCAQLRTLQNSEENPI